MFEDKYRQANDSLHPREELLLEMQRKQRRPAPYLRLSTVAACAVVVLALGVFFTGRFLGGMKSADSSAADMAPQSMGAEYNNAESAMDTVGGAETDDGAVSESAPILTDEKAGETEEAAPEEREIAAISDTLTCWFEAENSLLYVQSEAADLRMEIPEAAGHLCTGVEIEGELVRLRFAEGEDVLVLAFESTLCRYVQKTGMLEVYNGQGIAGVRQLFAPDEGLCTHMERSGRLVYLTFASGEEARVDLDDLTAVEEMDE